MDIIGYVDALYIDMERCRVEKRAEGYIKDKIASTMRAAIFDSLQEQRQMDPETPNMRLECLKLASSRTGAQGEGYAKEVIALADHLLRYVTDGLMEVKTNTDR